MIDPELLKTPHPSLPMTTTELMMSPKVSFEQVLETLDSYAEKANYVPGKEMVGVIERFYPTAAQLAKLQDIAAQGIINATRAHSHSDLNPHSEYPDMLTAVQSGYAQILGYAGLLLEDPK